MPEVLLEPRLASEVFWEWWNSERCGQPIHPTKSSGPSHQPVLEHPLGQDARSVGVRTGKFGSCQQPRTESGRALFLGIEQKEDESCGTWFPLHFRLETQERLPDSVAEND